MNLKKYYFEGCYNVCFLNGEWAPDLSEALPEGMTLKNEPIKSDVYFQCREKLKIDKPIHFLFLINQSTPSSFCFSHHIEIQAQAEVMLIEQYVSLTETLPTSSEVMTDIVLGKNATLRHAKMILENNVSQHLGKQQVMQDEKSYYETVCFSLSGLSSIHETCVKLEGEYAEAYLSGLYCADHHHKVEQRVAVLHKKQNTTSRETFKGMVNHQARGLFEGKIVVDKQAQGSQASLSNKNIVLSTEAKLETTPQLEIYADDVKCTHGATVGCLDEAVLFYLQSRGLPLEEAKQLLLSAFASDLVSTISFKPLKEKLIEKIGVF
ncbi:MAG: Fe-S cluster assembly protein SufD [Gammaproteobacteria bacterium]|nr:Fe-S cluster assembly protein SufD [Gammaproteobacteria bacterium]